MASIEQQHNQLRIWELGLSPLPKIAPGATQADIDAANSSAKEYLKTYPWTDHPNAAQGYLGLQDWIADVPGEGIAVPNIAYYLCHGGSSEWWATVGLNANYQSWLVSTHWVQPFPMPRAEISNAGIARMNAKLRRE